MAPTIIVLMIYAQPNSGESYFNLTNTHSLTTLALFIILATSPWERFGWPTNVFVAIASVSGPFSMIAAPLLIIRLIFTRDFFRNILTHTLFFIGATIQALVFFSSDRLRTTETADLTGWAASFGSFVTFGQTGALAVSAVAVLLVTCTALIINPTRDFKRLSSALFLLSTGALFLGAGTLSEGTHGHLMSPMGHAARYFFLPYALFIIAITIFISCGRAKNIVALAFSVFLLAQALHNQNPLLSRTELNFQSYAWLSRHIDHTIIPINPQWAAYPGWHMNIDRGVYGPSRLNAITITGPETHRFQPTTFDHQGPASEQKSDSLLLRLNPACMAQRFLGMDLTITADHDGWIRVAPANEQGQPQNLLAQQRFYPAGTSWIQLALNQVETDSLVLSVSSRDQAYVLVEFSSMLCGG